MKSILFLLLCIAYLQASAQDPDYPTTTIPANLVQAEYFFDTDPGFGNGASIAISPGVNLTNIAATISYTGLSGGIHRFYLRLRSEDGGWGLTNSAELLVDFNPDYPANPAAQNLTKAEYFIDTDPGFGNGTGIAIAPSVDIANAAAAINTAGLSAGVHRLYLRTQGAEGRWSITNQKDFLVDENPAYPTPPATPGNLVYAEYFFDTDPGFGSGTPITFSPTVDLSNITIAVPTTNLSDGMHRFYLRTLDDWSITAYQSFLKGNPLPLRLLSFGARNAGRSVVLNWQTEAEINTSHFDIERSGDGSRFEMIGTMASTNSLSRHLYTLDDAQPLDGKAFYRLKQVDRDGRFEYSATLLVNRSKGLELQLFPNPAQTVLKVAIPQKAEPQQLLLTNANAQVLKTVTVAAGAGSVDLQVADLQPGRYFVRWQSNNDVLVKGFIKQ